MALSVERIETLARRESEASNLQDISDTFYEDVGEVLTELREEKQTAVEAADDPYTDPQVELIVDDIRLVEDEVHSMYERRVGKLVKRASLAASGMTDDPEGLPPLEDHLYREMKTALQAHRDRVKELISSGAPSDEQSATPDTAAPEKQQSPPEEGLPPGAKSSPPDISTPSDSTRQSVSEDHQEGEQETQTQSDDTTLSGWEDEDEGDDVEVAAASVFGDRDS